MDPSSDDLIPTRASLLSRLRDLDDRTSWQTFFDTYGGLILGLALKCGLSRTEAEEVVQETCVSVARQMPGFRYDPAVGSFKGWLLQITRRRIADQFRRRPVWAQDLHRDPETMAAEALPPTGLHGQPEASVPADAERLWDLEWKRHLLARAFARVRAKVGARQFQMFDLYVNQQWPMAALTRALGVNRAQVYMAKLRVSRMLRREIASLETQET